MKAREDSSRRREEKAEYLRAQSKVPLSALVEIEREWSRRVREKYGDGVKVSPWRVRKFTNGRLENKPTHEWQHAKELLLQYGRDLLLRAMDHFMFDMFGEPQPGRWHPGVLTWGLFWSMRDRIFGEVQTGIRPSVPVKSREQAMTSGEATGKSEGMKVGEW